MNAPNQAQAGPTSRSTADKIVDTVKSYQRAPVNTPNIDGLIRLRQNLTTLCFEFALEVKELYEEKVASEFRRKAAFARYKKAGIDEGMSATKAEAEAEVKVEELRKDEMTADALYRGSFMLLDSAKEVSNTLSQHIANVRHEKAREMTGQGSQ